MAGNLPKIGVQAVVDGVNQYLNDLDKMDRAVTDSAGNIQKAAKSSDALAKAMQGVGRVVAGLGLSGLFVGMIKSASDSETVITELNAALKSTEGRAGVTSDSAQKLATSLQKVTRFSDETVLSVETLLLRFQGMSQDVLPGATKAVLNIATALKMDTGSAAKLLGRLMQDPIDSMNALQRAGIKFTDAQQRQTKALVYSGKALEAQKYLLDQVAIATGGAAEAAGMTFAGKLDILKNQFDDLLETAGGYLLPVLTQLIGVVSKFITALGPAAPALLITAAAFGALTLAVGPLGTALGIILSPIGAIVLAVGALAAAFATNFGGIRTAVEGAWSAISKPLGDIRDALGNFMTTLFPEPKYTFTGMKDGVAQYVEQSTGSMGDRLTKAFATLGPQIKKAIEDIFTNLGLDPAIIDKVIQVVQGPLDSLKNGIQGFIDGLKGRDFSGVQKLLDAIGQALSALAALIGATVLASLDAIGKALPLLGAALGDFVDGLSKLTAGDVGGFLSQVGAGLLTIGIAALSIPMDLATRLGSFLGIDVKGGLAAWQGIADNLGIILGSIWKNIQNTWNNIILSVGSAIWSIKFNVMMTWFDIQTSIDTTLGNIKTGIENIWNGIVAFVNGIANGVRSAFNAISNAITSALKPAFDFLNELLARIRDILGFKPPSWAGGSGGPGQGGGSGGTSPSFHAAGGSVMAGSTSWVGERGPELVTFAHNGFVFPNSISQALASVGNLMAQPAMAPSMAGNTNYNYNNVSTNGDIIMNGVSGTDDSIRRYSMLRALGRLR